jgi:hypothetical protein
MKVPRFRVAWLMVAVALIGLQLAVICADEPLIGLDGLEVGLLPGVTALTITLFSMIGTRGRPRPFAWGFVAALVVAMCVYIVCCLTIPELLRVSIVYEVDRIVKYIADVNPILVFRLCLEIQSLILGLPQLTFALLGGFLFRRFRVTVPRPG